MIRTVGLSGLVCLSLAAGAGAQEQHDEQSGTWRFEFANDAVFDSDNLFTNGFELHKDGPIASSLDKTRGTPAFGKTLARLFLPDTDGLTYREGWALGQYMQTPERIEDPDIILDSVPYLGMLAWTNSFVAFDDQRMTGFGWMIGMAGPSSFAEEVQSGMHRVVSATDPKGWDNQLDDEPVLSLFFTKKKKLWRSPGFDGAIAFNTAASNFLSYGEVAMEMRFGRMPKGFAIVSDPTGRGPDYNAVIRGSDGTALYGTVVVRATRFLVNMPLEGNKLADNNQWTRHNTIEPKDVVGQVYIGFNYERPTWALRLNFGFASSSVKCETIAPGEAHENNFGTISYEWQF